MNKECENMIGNINNKRLKKALEYYYLFEENEFYSEVLLSVLSDVFEMRFTDRNITINNDDYSEIIINMSLDITTEQLIYLMFNDLISITPIYINDDYDLGIRLRFGKIYR